MFTSCFFYFFNISFFCSVGVFSSLFLTFPVSELAVSVASRIPYFISMERVSQTSVREKKEEKERKISYG